MVRAVEEGTNGEKKKVPLRLYVTSAYWSARIALARLQTPGAQWI